jgi:hypothetical protein
MTKVAEYLRLVERLDQRRNSGLLSECEEDDLDGRIEQLWLQMTEAERTEADRECEAGQR